MQIQRTCPVCNEEKYTVLFKQRFAHSDYNPIVDYVVVVCDRCGMGYVNPVPDQHDWDQYYMQFSKYATPTTISEVDQFRFSIIAEFLKDELISESATILDVGCGSGGLLKTLAQKGFHQLTGLEPAPVGNHFSSQDSSILFINEPFDSLNVESYYDVIILEQVLEHLGDVRRVIQKVSALQKPGGLVYIGVPDGLKFKDCSDGPFQQFSVEHINFFSLEALKRLMNIFGFRRVKEQQILYSIAHNIETTALMTLWCKDNKPLVIDIGKDLELGSALSGYIEQSDRDFREIYNTVAKLVGRGSELYIWGAGTHTLRLIENTKLNNASIRAIIDSNPFYLGRSIRGIPIIPSDIALESTLPILISSCISQNAIVKYIRDSRGLGNELILLYPEERG